MDPGLRPHSRNHWLDVMVWDTLPKLFLNSLFLFQVYPGGLAGGSGYHEGLFQPVPSHDSGLCGPVPEAEACTPCPAPAVGDCLHGHLHTVRALDGGQRWSLWSSQFFPTAQTPPPASCLVCSTGKAL